MTIEEAKHKLDYMKKSYQKLIDEKVDSGELVGDGVRGEWKAETPLDEAYKSMIDALEIAIKALEQESCEDYISRQAVLKAIDGKAWEFCDYLIRNGRNDEQKPVSHFADNLRECVGEDLPSVTAQPKVGYWEWVQYDSNPNIGNWHCSECRTIIPHMPEETDNTPIYKWCPMCGAKMQEVQDE